MVKESWGTKRTCPCGNGVRFYDLNKKEIECTSCGENINVEQLSISTLENNLRKKPQAPIVKEKKKLDVDVEGKSIKKKLDVEIDPADNTKDVLKEIIGDKIKKKEKKR